MPTIQDTLDEIIILQDEMTKYEATQNDTLFNGLLNFTAIIYFEFSAHVILDNLPKSNSYETTEISHKYFGLLSDSDLLSEYIKYINIGHLFIIWHEYEKYIRGKCLNDFRLEEFNIGKLFGKFIAASELDNSEKIKEEFTIIRYTRNSLHDGGVYNSDFDSFTGILENTTYTFEPGKTVVPLRIMDIIKTIWSHYKVFEKLS